MRIEVLFAQGSENIPLSSGAIAQVRKGQHWPSTDPVVKLRPDLFTSDPRFGLLYSEAPPGYDTQLNELEPQPAAEVEDTSDASDVEDTSAVPGEKRSVRRPAR